MDLTLYGESTWVSPWVFHVMVALEEKRLPYRLELPPLPLPAETKALLRDRTILGKVPALVHGDTWIGDSLAISEYLAETFPAPTHPRIFPALLGTRARARAIMLMLRTGLGALREARPTSSVFGAPLAAPAPLAGKAADDAAELIRVATALLAQHRGAAEAEQRYAFGAFCVADADLALALMRLVANGDPVPAEVAHYARAVWARPSVARYLELARAR